MMAEWNIPVWAQWLIIAVYAVSLTCILVYSLLQLHLSVQYRRATRKKRQSVPVQNWPMVTVQLPVFNEKYVVERLIDCVAAFDYPSDKLEIQVLDDSTDESFEIAARKVDELSAQGINIHHVQRPERKGYKAGALQYGLGLAKGEFIAIFDSDFLPKADFLKRTMGQFDDPNIGMVQTRWGHINEDYSLLTKVQAFHLNAHFTVEQGARDSAALFLNFNGTAGVWRRQAMIDGGGWEADTLTEDLDLSYRTQMKGWKFAYLEDVVAPAELPAVMSAVKSQQYRWMKGGAETARKHVGKLLGSKLPWRIKLHGLAHLLNSSIFLFVFTTAICSVPLLFIKNSNPSIEPLFHAASIFLVAFAILIFFYVQSLRVREERGWHKWWYLISMFPSFLCMSMGMALHNSIAVLKGYFGQQSPFIRTPKFNIAGRSDQWKGNKYLSAGLNLVTISEGLLAIYFAWALYMGIHLEEYSLSLFHLMLFLGYGAVFTTSIKHARMAG